jgi:Lrp/AsnC family transcriptional regulator for asnA, asnC and gidA
VRARYGRLTGEGILQVVAVTNPLGLGFDQALVGVKTSGPPSDVADEIARWPEADYVVVTAGRFDLVVEVVVGDRHALLDLTNRIRSLEGVTSTETFFYLEMWKQLYDWGTRGQGGAE